MSFTLTTCIWYSISTLLVVCVYSSSVLASNTTCPTWFYYNNVTCECGQPFGGKVHCNQQERKAEIANGFCPTSTEQEGLYYAGDCPFKHTENNTDRMFSEMPSDPDLLNDAMCGPYNRKGLLCGRCIDGYGPAVYSLDIKCANCSKISTGFAICLYLFLELIPITLFFMCVLFFRLNIISGPLLGYVLFSQVYMFVIQRDLYIYKYISSHSHMFLKALFKFSLILCSSWILKFLRFTISPFCISTKLTGIHIQMLNLVTAIYPVLLVIITYILMELHARNYRIIHILWKPFSFLTNRLKITSVTSDAVIHAFATFILLSASTLTFNGMIVFTLSPVHESIDGKIYQEVLYYDPTITAYSHEHILYGALAVMPFILLVLIPSLLLCVYPTRIYECLSRVVSGRKRLAITAFAEALNNCFKDGLNGTQNYRSLAGLFLSYALSVQSVIYVTILTTRHSHDVSSAFALIFLSLVISYVRPCKSTIANLSLSYHHIMGGILSLAVHLWTYDLSTTTEALEMTFIIIPVISHVLILTWAAYTLTHRIMKHFGYHFNPFNFKVALTDLAKNLQQFICGRCRHDGYNILPDTAAQ